MQGKLIVFEGTDGSGKSTQFRLLCDRLNKEKIEFHNIVFPRYSEDSSAMVRAYLNGEFGTKPTDVSAYAASTFYAIDRFASYRLDWGKLYQNGALILSDRYTTSNAAHQGAKLSDAEQPDYYDWLYDFEYRILGLPRPDLVIYLNVDIDTSLRLMQERQRATNTEGDIHETDTDYLRSCIRAGQNAASHYGWHVIDCVSNGNMRGMEDIHEEIYSLVRSVL
ncbi:MAG: thymidylate kinase [Ruminococcaceae bacterium]|nr:thymidylate kinase [Oscillospiraceae bacterium]